MTKPKEYICPQCKEKVTSDESVKDGRRYYHPTCFKMKKEQEELKKQKAQDYKGLIDYICKLYKLDAPTGMILKQIKDYQEEYGYKLKGIELALRYFHETLGNPVREGDGIGIVPFVYEDAKRYYIMKMNVEESIKNCGENFVTKKIVTIKSPKLEMKRKVKPIDISSL